MRVHAHALLVAVGAPEHFATLGVDERRRNMHVLVKFLCSVASYLDVDDSNPRAREDATHGESDEEVAESAAMALADGLRRTGALGAIAEMAGTSGYDRCLAFSCLANLARLGLVDALCREAAVRTACINGLTASRHDEELGMSGCDERLCVHCSA